MSCLSKSILSAIALGDRAGGRSIAAAILVASLAALATALAAEYVFGIVGCTLCVYQRIPYAVTAVIGGVALAIPAAHAHTRSIVVLCALVFAVGAALGAYHLGVQEGWWTEVGVCEGTLPTAGSITDLRAAASSPARPACDQVDFSLLGLPLAGLNAAASAVLSLACAVIAVRRPGASAS